MVEQAKRRRRSSKGSATSHRDYFQLRGKEESIDIQKVLFLQERWRNAGARRRPLPRRMPSQEIRFFESPTLHNSPSTGGNAWWRQIEIALSVRSYLFLPSARRTTLLNSKSSIPCLSPVNIQNLIPTMSKLAIV